MLSKLVAKFGGTCLADADARARTIDHCRSLLREYDRLIVVVSAMGRKNDPYATDTLLGLASDALPREKDNLMSCGEIISAVVVACMLRESGIDAMALSGRDAGIITDDVECNSMIECVDRGLLDRYLEDHSCLVIAGFQGMSRDGRTTTLGRGGSDVTALALAAALEADDVVLYKTVDSVFTADPNRVPKAKRISRMSTEDLRQMAWQGAKVVHPRAAEIAGNAGLTLNVRSHSTGERVTEILPHVLESSRYITGVASGPEVCQIRAHASPESERSEFFSQVFSHIAEAGISMDMFSIMDGWAVFTVAVDDERRAGMILDGLGVDYQTRGPCCKVSIIGAGMHGLHGVMARFSTALSRAGITMLQTVDSHATISALVDLELADEALNALHGEFIEG